MSGLMLTPKQERFCHAYLEHGNASEAYRQSYNAGAMKPETVNRKASEVLSNGKVTARLEELRAPVVEATRITLEGHLYTLAELRNEARDIGQLSAAINAEIARGKVAGLYVDRQEITGKGGGPVELSTPKVDLSRLDVAELEQYAALAEKVRG